MINRCYNQNSKDYKFYGNKNIHICDSWLNDRRLFQDWSLENGYRDNLTIDRIDETKDYCPENCRWITLEENVRFKSTTNIIEVNGVTDSGKGWSKRLGLGINYINRYIRNNGIEEAIKFISNCLLE